MHAGEFLTHRCKDLLDDYATTYEQDVVALQAEGVTADLAMSIRHRMMRKTILLAGAGLLQTVQGQ